MSVEAYLCVTPHEGVYPSEHYADFEPEEHILARAADITPLLWLAMFRPGDLRDVPTRTGSAGELRRTRETALVTSRHQALTNLHASVAVLDRLLRGSLSGHAELLHEAMRSMLGGTVTIEWYAGDDARCV